VAAPTAPLAHSAAHARQPDAVLVREGSLSSNAITSHHISSHLITSHHISSHLITSHHIASHRITSHHISSHLITSHHISSHLITSHHISSHLISSHLITSHHITSHHITSQCLMTRDMYSFAIFWHLRVRVVPLSSSMLPTQPPFPTRSLPFKHTAYPTACAHTLVLETSLPRHALLRRD